MRDLIDCDDYGLLVIGGQGGRPFLERDEYGEVVRVQQTRTLKTDASHRVLVVPPALMQLLRLLIASYHTDPATGEVDLDARLVPGIERPNQGGQGGFRSAFAAGLRAEGLSAEQQGFPVTPHIMRKSLATDLAHSQLDALARRRVLGHTPGSDVHDRHYVLDDPQWRPQKEAASSIQRDIDQQIGELFVLNDKRPQFGATHPLRERVDYAETVLRAAWQATTEDDAEPLYNTAQVAERLAEPRTTVRRWMREGKLPVVEVDNGTGSTERRVPQSALRRIIDERLSLPTIAEVAHELGISYHEAWRTLKALDIEPQRDPSGSYRLQPHVVDALRNEIDRVAALHQRAMKLTDAAQQLNLHRSTVYQKVELGELVLDPECDSSGARFVTRASVAACHDRDRKRCRQPEAADGEAMPLGDVMACAGLSRQQVRSLIKAKQLEAVYPHGRCHVTAQSLHRWATGYRPDLLTVLEGTQDVGERSAQPLVND